jgi:hypothetical protein
MHKPRERDCMTQFIIIGGQWTDQPDTEGVTGIDAFVQSYSANSHLVMTQGQAAATYPTSASLQDYTRHVAFLHVWCSFYLSFFLSVTCFNKDNYAILIHDRVRTATSMQIDWLLNSYKLTFDSSKNCYWSDEGTSSMCIFVQVRSAY